MELHRENLSLLLEYSVLALLDVPGDLARFYLHFGKAVSVFSSVLLQHSSLLGAWGLYNQLGEFGHACVQVSFRVATLLVQLNRLLFGEGERKGCVSNEYIVFCWREGRWV